MKDACVLLVSSVDLSGYPSNLNMVFVIHFLSICRLLKFGLVDRGFGLLGLAKTTLDYWTALPQNELSRNQSQSMCLLSDTSTGVRGTVTVLSSAASITHCAATGFTNVESEWRACDNSVWMNLISLSSS